MGNKCCGNRSKPHEKPEKKTSEYTTKQTEKERAETKDTNTKKERNGSCPYCQEKIPILDNLKYLQCPICKERSMQDGCTETLYK